MKVVILAGGYGTRIRDVADDIPKPMIPIGRYPILWHIMKMYSRFGHREFIICLGYKGHIVKDFFLNYEAYTRDLTISLGGGGLEYHNSHDESDWKVTLADTGVRSMTGARISRIRDYVKNEDFMLTYGDGLSDVNIDQLLAFHRSHGKVLTVTGVRTPGRFGEIIGEVDGQIVGFDEKPKTSSGGRISGGFFVCSPRLFDYLDDQEDLVFEQRPIRQLVKDRQLMMFTHDGFWQAMDTSREYQLLNSLYESGEAPWTK